MAAFYVALRAKDELVGSIGLVVIKFQGLSDSRVGDVEVNVILQVCGCINGAKLLPPQSV